MVELPAVTLLVTGERGRKSKFGVAVILSATVPQDSAMVDFLNSLEAVLRGAAVTPGSFESLTEEMRAHLVEGIHLADKHRVFTPARSLEIALSVPSELGLRLWNEIGSFADPCALSQDHDAVSAVIRSWVQQRAASETADADEGGLAARLYQVSGLLEDAELSSLIQRRFPQLGEVTINDLSCED